MTKRKLPIGIQTFREVREDNCYYVDKTAYIRRLLNEGKHFFLSRPRRFGKSLFLDTCKELFESNEPLFEGLYIHDRWDWSVRCHPVLRLDFSSGTYQGPDDLREEMAAQLNALEEEAEIIPRAGDTAPARFRRLMKVLHERTGQRVAVLIDEYDKPILDALGGVGGRPRQPRLSARSVFDREVCRRPHPLHLPHWGEQVLQGQPVLRPQQPDRHHPRPALLSHLRLYRGRPK